MELRRIAGDDAVDVEATLSINQAPIKQDEEENNQEEENDTPARTNDLTSKVHRHGQIQKSSKNQPKNQKKGFVKNKEHAKRMKGQSSQASWKPEEFMKNRQNFD